MSYCDDNYVEWVRKAQLGDRHSLDRLAEAARVRLHAYVFRLTLEEDVTQDIVQETILTMLKVLGKLRRAERFWSWIYGIAFNKARNHYGKRWRRKTRTFSETGYEPSKTPGGDALAQVVTEELKEIVLRSVRELEPRHRAVLTMRCYDQMSYAEIAQLMGSSEMGTRALFYRAKKALARQLSARGLGKGSLVLALVAFGKMTATTEAAATQVSITGASLQVGPGAALLAMATGRTALLTAVATGSVVAGSIATGPALLGTRRAERPDLPQAAWESRKPTTQRESWYYFPEGGRGPVMTRVVEAEAAGAGPFCRVLENQYANCHADDRMNTVYISNHRAWRPDLSVQRLPTDSPALIEHLAKVEGKPGVPELTQSNMRGLLVICREQVGRDTEILRVDRQLNVLEEEYFLFSWPESIRTIDNRDRMHERGRAYFRLTGRIRDRPVSGTGRLPLVYAAARRHYPWLRLQLGRNRRRVDTPDGARVIDAEGRVSAHYRGGAFFAGLPRPWMGLHCIDTVRRDAAEQRLHFDTAYDAETARATVTVRTRPLWMVYTIDMNADLVEAIVWVDPESEPKEPVGELRFEYLPDIESPAGEFLPPKTDAGPVSRTEPGMLWLSELAARR